MKELELKPKNNQETRSIMEVQAAVVVAQQIGRDEGQARDRVIQACSNTALAESAEYSYKVGSTLVEGPTIRLIEMIARNWGNIQFGVNELEITKEYTKYEAYCWDMLSNTRASMTVTQSHVRHTRSGSTLLKSPKEIYEYVTSYSMRRLRKCIEQVIPSDLVDEAKEACRKTLTKTNITPLSDRIEIMVERFEKYKVTAKMIETFTGHSIESTSESELIKLFRIYNSLKDKVGEVKDYFKEPKEKKTLDLGDTGKKVVNNETIMKESSKVFMEQMKTPINEEDEKKVKVIELRKIYVGKSWTSDQLVKISMILFGQNTPNTLTLEQLDELIDIVSTCDDYGTLLNDLQGQNQEEPLEETKGNAPLKNFADNITNDNGVGEI